MRPMIPLTCFGVLACSTVDRGGPSLRYAEVPRDGEARGFWFAMGFFGQPGGTVISAKRKNAPWAV